MARKPRLHIPGGLYHVTLKGNGGDDIFFDKEDRYHFYLLLQEGVARFGHRIHGFCLMNNHIHLAIQVADEPLSKIMQNISFRYTRWINKKQQRIGHLFQGRYNAIIVESESYLLELVRYIHLNPVRAKLVRKPARYQWSSHNAYLGNEVLPWLTVDWLLSQLAKREKTARKRYEQFVNDGINEGYREEFHKGSRDNRVLGDDSFIERVTGEKKEKSKPEITLSELSKRFCLLNELEEKELVGPSRLRRVTELRSIFAWVANSLEIASLEALGEFLHRDATTLSRAVSRVKENRRNDERARGKLDKLKSTLTRA